MCFADASKLAKQPEEDLPVESNSEYYESVIQVGRGTSVSLSVGCALDATEDDGTDGTDYANLE